MENFCPYLLDHLPGLAQLREREAPPLSWKAVWGGGAVGCLQGHGHNLVDSLAAKLEPARVDLLLHKLVDGGFMPLAVALGGEPHVTGGTDEPFWNWMLKFDVNFEVRFLRVDRGTVRTLVPEVKSVLWIRINQIWIQQILWIQIQIQVDIYTHGKI